MSYWEHPKPVHRRRAIDVEALASAAVSLLDEGGLRACTIRAVAERLRVAPASLYSRIDGTDDLLDLALDHALGEDPDVGARLDDPDVHRLLLAFHRHLRRHPWACQVIGFRAPRGPHYLRLSERLCVLLERAGAKDPLGTSYALSNFVIGSALTFPLAARERAARVDPEQAPLYARLHAGHAVDPEEIVGDGLRALLKNATADR